jgi:predicted metal-dependent peptidase
MVSPVPTVALVADTSGSMGRDERAVIVQQVRDIITALRAPLTVIDCDAAVHTVRKVKHASSTIELAGGGGTDMRVGLAAAAETRADVVVVVTDGDTPWPSARPAGIGAVVVVLTAGTYRGAVPKWATTIVVD